MNKLETKIKTEIRNQNPTKPADKLPEAKQRPCANQQAISN
jgi:hypothetical protein